MEHSGAIPIVAARMLHYYNWYWSSTAGLTLVWNIFARAAIPTSCLNTQHQLPSAPELNAHASAEVAAADTGIQQVAASTGAHYCSALPHQCKHQ